MPLLGAPQEVAEEGRPDVPSGVSLGARKNRGASASIFLRSVKDSALASAFGSPNADTKGARKQESKRYCHLLRTPVCKNFKQDGKARIFANSEPILGVRLCAQDGGILPNKNPRRSSSERREERFPKAAAFG